MVPDDPSKRRLHIGKHILKALCNVSDTPAPVNTVSGLWFVILFFLYSNVCHRLTIFPAGHVVNQHCKETVLLR